MSSFEFGFELTLSHVFEFCFGFAMSYELLISYLELCFLVFAMNNELSAMSQIAMSYQL